VGYEWLDAGLRSLRDLEPYEVMQVIFSERRRPIPATNPDGRRVLTIWGRTAAGRPVIVMIRPLPGSQWDWQILGADAMTKEQIALHEAWEATRDDQ
jgi:hypothetical protein